MGDQSSTWRQLSWTIRLFSSAINYALQASCRSDGSINRLIANLFTFPVPITCCEPISGVKSSDVAVDPSQNLWFRLYMPEGGNDVAKSNSMPVIFFFHGGGFVLMSAKSLPYDSLCRRLSRELSSVIISVNYRLAPEHRYPCQYEDGINVLKFVDNNTNLFPTAALVNLKQCFIAGDSAGGNLAHNVAVRACECEFRNLKVIGVIALQPFFGGEERTESEIRLVNAPFINTKLTDWYWKAFLPEGSNRDHPAANVFGPHGVDIAKLNFPATIVIVGGFDPLRDWQKRYYEGLKKSGKEAYLVEYPNAFHAFYSMSVVPESSLCIQEIKDFIEKQCAK